MAGGLVAELNKRKDELEAANKRIAELEVELYKSNERINYLEHENKKIDRLLHSAAKSILTGKY